MFERLVSCGPYGQWLAALATTCAVLISGIICSWPNAAFPKMQDGSAGFDFSESEKSWLATFPFLAAVISPIPISYIMDKIGRKTTLHISTLLVLTSWIIISFSNNYVLLSIARLMSGLYCGTEYITVSIIVAEYVDPKIRGTLISVTGMTFYSGALYVSLISYADYQTMCILCGIPSLILFTIFMFLPETPYFYLMKGKREDAANAITWLRGHCDKEEFNRIETGVQEQLSNKGTFKEIFVVKSNRNAFILIELFKVFSAGSSCIVLFSYCTQLIPDSFVSAKNSFVLLCLLWVFAAFVSSTIMDRFPRRGLLVFSSIGTIAFFTITTVWYYLRDKTQIDVSNYTWVPLVSVIFGSFFEVIGIINIPNVLKGEIFPVNIKTKAVALSCSTACACETLNVYFYYTFNQLIGEYFNFLKPTITACICLYITIFHLFETKGYSLETIQAILTGKITAKEAKEQQRKIDRL